MKFDDALHGEDSILLAPPNGERVVLGEWHRGIVGLVVCTGNIEIDGREEHWVFSNFKVGTKCKSAHLNNHAFPLRPVGCPAAHRQLLLRRDLQQQ